MKLELYRLFRTNAFNQIKRKNFEEEKFNKYPVINEHNNQYYLIIGPQRRTK